MPGRRDGTPARVVDLGDAVILPGLVNAHTHLELSWMRDRVPPGSSMPAWASQLLALRRAAAGDPARSDRRGHPPGRARRARRSSGTSPTRWRRTISWRTASLAGAVFRELIGFAAEDPDRIVARAETELDVLRPLPWLRPSIVPHAPYSVAPALFRAIARASQGRPISVHLAESPEEIQFLHDGTGAWRELLEQLGAWNTDWEPPACGPVEYLDRMGLVTGRLLAVHGTQLTDAELARLAEAGATVVTCPRSNRWTGAGTPPVERFYGSGVRVAIGTDSLASVEDLNLFEELAAVRRLAPGVPAARLLESATVVGAAALGFASEFGTLEPGKRADAIAVSLPAGVEDVEEYLAEWNRAWRDTVAGFRVGSAFSVLRFSVLVLRWFLGPRRARAEPRAPREPRTKNLNRTNENRERTENQEPSGTVNRLLTYASFVRFSHSVFALPFALTGALLALHRLGEWSPATVGGALRVDRARDGGRAERRDGLQSPGRRVARRAQSTDRGA